MWKILENEKGRHKVQKYRPSSDKELIEAPHLKFRKMLPIVSVTFYHDVGMQEFKAVARIERIRDGKKIVGERWRFCLSKPVNVQARGTQEGYTSEEIFRQRLVINRANPSAAVWYTDRDYSSRNWQEDRGADEMRGAWP